MTFQPRIRSASETNPGVVCCSAPGALCDKCKAHFRAASFRTAAQHDYTPPDPYRAGLERLRRELPEARWPEPTTTPPLDAGGIPDAYAAGLARMRKEQQR